MRAVPLRDGPIQIVSALDLEQRANGFVPHRSTCSTTPGRVARTATPAGHQIVLNGPDPTDVTFIPGAATNLGVSGNCMLDPFVARTIRDLDVDAISLFIGIKILGGDTMRERTFAPAVHGFLDMIREGHPDTPIVVISPIFCPSAEDRPGPRCLDPTESSTRSRVVTRSVAEHSPCAAFARSSQQSSTRVAPSATHTCTSSTA